MHMYTGYFADPENHHTGWFRIFRGKGVIEIWAGHRYATIFWGK